MQESEKLIRLLEKEGELIRIHEEVDGYLEASAIHQMLFRAKGPAVLFERIKGSRFSALSNVFGTEQRTRIVLGKPLSRVMELVQVKTDPAALLSKPGRWLPVLQGALHALPQRCSASSIRKSFAEISVSDLPAIVNWPDDGGAFVTMPQVYTEHPDQPGWKSSNLGMYRIQLNGNDYRLNHEIGLHYQLHRGIGVHHTAWEQARKPMPVSIFIGGPAAHAFAAVMPLPEGMPELSFAGALAGKRFRYAYDENGNMVSLDADFVITGYVNPGETAPEGPFGDHLGYYSLKHPFPLMKVRKVYAARKAVWNFTVVGRPPQEDTAFGSFIHSISGKALTRELPGLVELNAVDEAGVHPLLLAIGSERYHPFLKTERPQEILTLANHILGKGQLSLAKYVFVLCPEPGHRVHTHPERAYFDYFLRRIDFSRDLHFYTRTTIDTLDYSGDGLNSGSKLVLAALGAPLRELDAYEPPQHSGAVCKRVAPGILAFSLEPNADIGQIRAYLQECTPSFRASNPLLIACDDATFLEQNVQNFLWVCFTRSNPAADVYGFSEQIVQKHWGCEPPLIIDARTKSHHAPGLSMPAEILQSIDRFNRPGHPLHRYF